MMLPEHEFLHTNRLGNLFGNMSESYKLFWFKAIVEAIEQGKAVETFDELINHMVSDAWYMVNEYRLNLGPSDTLEKLVKLIFNRSNFKSCEKQKEVVKYLRNGKDKEILECKRILTYNVPYRIMAPLFNDKMPGVWKNTKTSTEYIKSFDNLLYKIEDGGNSLRNKVILNPNWSEYIRKNLSVIKGWIDYNMIIYIQRRNPSVPGISNKLYPPAARNLDKVKIYWKAIINATEVRDIYTGNILSNDMLSIDHFVPWSYVAHDELWNLSPTTRSINSSKNSSLPEWERYFKYLANQEYDAYKLINEYDHLRDLFEKCKKEHLNNMDIVERLYRPELEKETFSRELKSIIWPVYESANNMGFSKWRYKN